MHATIYPIYVCNISITPETSHVPLTHLPLLEANVLIPFTIDYKSDSMSSAQHCLSYLSM